MKYFFIVISALFSSYNFASETPCIVIQSKHTLCIGIYSEENGTMIWQHAELPFFVKPSIREGIIEIKKKKNRNNQPDKKEAA